MGGDVGGEVGASDVREGSDAKDGSDACVSSDSGAEVSAMLESPAGGGGDAGGDLDDLVARIDLGEIDLCAAAPVSGVDGVGGVGVVGDAWASSVTVAG